MISELKKEPFVLDAKIPYSYILIFCLKKTIYLLYGTISLLTTKKVFRALDTTIKCKNKLKIKGTLVIQKKTYIDALSQDGIIFGNNVSIGKYTTIECTGSLKNIGKGLTIGNNVGLGTHGFWGCAGGIKIGDDCIFGNYVSLHSENHNYADTTTLIRLQGVNRKGISIGNNCWLGAKSTILDGTIIGNGCIVAAGAVVSGKFPDNVIIGGVPAKILKKISSSK